jgi:ribosome maturation factor RimP
MVEGRKRFKGKIQSVGEDSFTLERDQIGYGEEPTVVIPFAALAEARLILTDDLIRDALKADKLARAEAANENNEDEAGES